MTRYHTLTPAEFDVIASGDPDAAVIETLQSAQYSKRIVLIKAIMEAAVGRCPGVCPQLEEAYGLLAASQVDDPAAVRAVLTYPGVGSWAARCLRGLKSRSSDSIRLAADLGQFTAIAAAAGIRSGRAFAIDIPMRGNTVNLPTLGLATMAEADTVADATVSRDVGQRAVTVIAGHEMVTLPDDPSQNGPGWQGLRGLRSCHGDASISVEFDDLDPCRDTDGTPLAGRQSGDAMAGWQAVLDGAWAILAHHHPRRARALATGLRCITPLERTGPGDKSVTDEASFGGVMLTRPRDPLALADTLVHEFQHSVLCAVSDLVRLHTAGLDAVHYSPWRDDPRPIEGLLQGAYAYLGVTGYWEVQRRMLTGRHQMLADFEFARWRHQIISAAQALADSGTLTVAGTVLVRGMATAAERWHGLPVADEPDRLAAQANADHRVRWRLRNRHPDPAAIDVIATAWQDGGPCPGRLDEIAATVLPQQRQLPRSERLRLLRLRLADPGRFAERCAAPSQPDQAGIAASAADLAYAKDDFERAVDGYRAAIQAKPDDIESWTGLVLATTELRGGATGFMAAPEIARSVYLRILESEGARPGLDALENWAEIPARSTNSG